MSVRNERLICLVFPVLKLDCVLAKFSHILLIKNKTMTDTDISLDIDILTHL